MQRIGRGEEGAVVVGQEVPKMVWVVAAAVMRSLETGRLGGIILSLRLCSEAAS
jgi:hypothetical protein